MRRRPRPARLLIYEQALNSGLTPREALDRVRQSCPDLSPDDERLLSLVAAPPSGAGSGPGGYEVLEKLGEGGMGVVHKARQVALNRLVALKMILGGRAVDQGRFRTECEAVARLQHPHIVQVFEVGEHRGQPFVSLELCPGGSLDARLHQGLPAPAQAAAWVEALARAMHAAHLARVVHRDLKPANVLLTADGTVKVTDFGLARKLDDAGLTQPGEILGSPSYMAPEQALGSTAVGPAADVWGLGAILYECLTGRPPFRAATPLDTLAQVVGTDPAAPRSVNRSVPPDLETVCLKCLRKDPAQRYASAADLADDLRRFLEGRPIVARPVGAAERAWRWSRRNLLAASLLAAVAVLLIGGAAAGTVGTLFYRERARSEQEAREEADWQSGRAADAEHAARVEAARDALARGNWDEALKNYQIAIGHGRDDRTQLEIERLRGWFTVADRPRLKAELDRLAALPDLTPAQRGLVLLHTGDYLLTRSDAIARARAMVADALKHPLAGADAAYARGLLAEGADDATRLYREALSHDRFHHRANSGLACELLLSGRFDEARRAAEFMSRIYPRDPVATFTWAWADLLEGDPASSRRHRADLLRLLHGQPTAGIDRLFAEMDAVVTTLTRWEQGQLTMLAALSRLTLSAARLAGMHVGTLEPVGFPSPAVARLFQAADEGGRAAVLWQLGFLDAAMARLRKAERLHPDGAIRLLIVSIQATRLPHLRKDEKRFWREADEARRTAFEAAEAPTLLPYSPFRYQARMVAVAMDSVSWRREELLLAELAGAVGAFTGAPGLPTAVRFATAKPAPLDPGRPGRVNAHARRLLHEGHHYAAARRELLPHLGPMMPARVARLLGEDWLFDEPDSVPARRLLAGVELAAGNPAAARAHCERGLKLAPRDRDLLQLRLQAGGRDPDPVP